MTLIEETMVKSAFNIAEYSQNYSKVRLVGIANKLANSMNNIINIWPSHS